MASVIINGASYTDVPYIKVPKVNGGGDALFFDTSGATALPAVIMAGYKAFGVNGEMVGTATMPTVSQDPVTKVLSIS